MSHAPADGRLTLYQNNLMASVGDIQSSLDTGDAAADNQSFLRDRYLLRKERLVAGNLGYRHPD